MTESVEHTKYSRPLIFLTSISFLGVGCVLKLNSDKISKSLVFISQLDLKLTTNSSIIQKSSSNTQFLPPFPPYNSPELQNPTIYGINDFYTQRETNTSTKPAFFSTKTTNPTILFYNNPWMGFPPRSYKLCGPEFTCIVKTSKSPEELRNADAVIVHPVFTKLEDQKGSIFRDFISKVRTERQMYLFLQWESPEFHTGDYREFNNFFNATLTYRQDSSFLFPYDSIVGLKLRAYFEEKTRKKLGLGDFTNITIEQLYKNPDRARILDENFIKVPRKEKLFGVAAVVSNCRSPYRSNTIKKLNKLLKNPDGTPALNYMGRCDLLDKAGNARGAKVYKKFKTGSGFAGLYKLAMRHKFFLSIENSRCRYYITEKFFENALLAGSVPIVAGAPRVDYEMIAPKSSFIHVDDFSSLEDLAGYVNYLMVNETAYNEYFNWWDSSKISSDFRLSNIEDYKKSGFCKLCSVLKDINSGKGRHWPAIENFQKYWYGSDQGTSYKSTCRRVRGEGHDKIRWRRDLSLLSDLFY